MKTLVVFARAPQLGRVKTRLARDIGALLALRAYRAMLAHTLHVAGDPRWRIRIAATPPPHFFQGDVFDQGKGDLGTRMARVFRDASPGPVVIIGTDCPSLGRHHIAQAFAALGRADCVIGPAEDGGYWLIGLNRTRAVPQLFNAVRWSGPHARTDTLASLPRGYTVALLDTLYDVDEAKDLARWQHRGRQIWR